MSLPEPGEIRFQGTKGGGGASPAASRCRHAGWTTENRHCRRRRAATAPVVTARTEPEPAGPGKPGRATAWCGRPPFLISCLPLDERGWSGHADHAQPSTRLRSVAVLGGSRPSSPVSISTSTKLRPSSADRQRRQPLRRRGGGQIVGGRDPPGRMTATVDPHDAPRPPLAQHQLDRPGEPVRFRHRLRGDRPRVIVGLGITPALHDLARLHGPGRADALRLPRLGGWIGRHRWRIFRLDDGRARARRDRDLHAGAEDRPGRLPPRNSVVTTDLKRVDSERTSVNSIEAVIDFGLTGSSFVERLKKVQEWEGMIRAMPGVRHTFSVPDFFPKQLPDSPTELGTLLGKAQSQQASQGYLAQQQRLWRISVRIQPGVSPAVACSDLEKLTAGLPIEYTGVSPLLVNAQNEIFTGFWQSFTGAVGMISIVMVVALRSFKMAALAMIPNILPIWLVFGLIGYAGVPVDIGMMMTGSIAIGISVDCTFHFLVAFREKLDEGERRSKRARRPSSTPDVRSSSTFISAVSMLAPVPQQLPPDVPLRLDDVGPDAGVAPRRTRPAAGPPVPLHPGQKSRRPGPSLKDTRTPSAARRLTSAEGTPRPGRARLLPSRDGSIDYQPSSNPVCSSSITR